MKKDAESISNPKIRNPHLQQFIFDLQCSETSCDLSVIKSQLLRFTAQLK